MRAVLISKQGEEEGRRVNHRKWTTFYLKEGEITVNYSL